MALCVAPLTLQAQSGRKAPPPAAPKPDAKPGVKEGASTSGDTVEGLIPVRRRAAKPWKATVRVDTSLVTVPVSVVDRKGKYVPSLRREDFRLFEEGVEQKIAYFATVDQPSLLSFD